MCLLKYHEENKRFRKKAELLFQSLQKEWHYSFRERDIQIFPVPIIIPLKLFFLQQRIQAAKCYGTLPRKPANHRIFVFEIFFTQNYAYSVYNDLCTPYAGFNFFKRIKLQLENKQNPWHNQCQSGLVWTFVGPVKYDIDDFF